MATPRPLAIGLLHVGPGASLSLRERTAARVHLALAVNERGYALIETFELGMGAVADDVAMAHVEELAVGHDVQVLVLMGDVDEARIQRLADRARLALWTPDLASGSVS